MSQRSNSVYRLRPPLAWQVLYTGAIDLNLVTYVPLGQLTSQNKFLSDLIVGIALTLTLATPGNVLPPPWAPS
jgi:hypothetical protein